MLILTPTSIIEIDAVLKVDLSADVDVTKLAVEQGTPISDSARKEPEEVEIEGLVTDAEVAGKSFAAYLDLTNLRGVLVSIVTPLEQYDSMTLTRLKIPQNVDTGEALIWEATFRHVRQVTLQQTTVATKKTGGKKTKGPQATTPATSQTLRSRWHSQFQSGSNPLVPMTSGG